MFSVRRRIESGACRRKGHSVVGAPEGAVLLWPTLNGECRRGEHLQTKGRGMNRVGGE